MKTEQIKLDPLAFSFLGCKVAEVSTAHISRKDNDILKVHVDVGPQEHPQVIMEYEHGYMVSTWHNGTDNPENLEEALGKLGHSEAYINLVMLVHRSGAKWLCLDCDAERYDFLPSFAWL